MGVNEKKKLNLSCGNVGCVCSRASTLLRRFGSTLFADIRRSIDRGAVGYSPDIDRVVMVRYSSRRTTISMLVRLCSASEKLVWCSRIPFGRMFEPIAKSTTALDAKRGKSISVKEMVEVNNNGQLRNRQFTHSWTSDTHVSTEEEWSGNMWVDAILANGTTSRH